MSNLPPVYSNKVNEVFTSEYWGRVIFPEPTQSPKIREVNHSYKKLSQDVVDQTLPFIYGLDGMKLPLGTDVGPNHITDWWVEPGTIFVSDIESLRITEASPERIRIANEYYCPPPEVIDQLIAKNTRNLIIEPAVENLGQVDVTGNFSIGFRELKVASMSEDEKHIYFYSRTAALGRLSLKNDLYESWRFWINSEHGKIIARGGGLSVFVGYILPAEIGQSQKFTRNAYLREIDYTQRLRSLEVIKLGEREKTKHKVAAGFKLVVPKLGFKPSHI